MVWNSISLLLEEPIFFCPDIKTRLIIDTISVCIRSTLATPKKKTKSRSMMSHSKTKKALDQVLGWPTRWCRWTHREGAPWIDVALLSVPWITWLPKWFRPNKPCLLQIFGLLAALFSRWWQDPSPLRELRTTQCFPKLTTERLSGPNKWRSSQRAVIWLTSWLCLTRFSV